MPNYFNKMMVIEIIIQFLKYLRNNVLYANRNLGSSIVLILGLFTFYSCSGSSDYTTPRILLQPVPKENLVSYFKNGIPIGALKGKNFDALVYLTYVTVLDRLYIKLWCLYQNFEPEPFLLEPQKHFQLSLKTNDGRKYSAVVISPSLILQRIENKKEESNITQSIGSALKVMSVQNTIIKGSDGMNYEYNDKSEKQANINSQSRSDILNTANWYTTFMSSINSGILRRNTLFSGEGVNGSIYFEIPLIMEKKIDKRPKSNTDENRYVTEIEEEINLRDLTYELSISTPEGDKQVVFKTIGEE